MTQLVKYVYFITCGELSAHSEGEDVCECVCDMRDSAAHSLVLLVIVRIPCLIEILTTPLKMHLQEKLPIFLPAVRMGQPERDSEGTQELLVCVCVCVCVCVTLSDIRNLLVNDPIEKGTVELYQQ